MLNLQPYLRRPLATLASIAADPSGAWNRFQEQLAAHREGYTPPDCYQAEPNWERRLHAYMDVREPSPVMAEFWALWPQVIKELEAKGVRAGPQSFKGWNDGDTAFVRAIWCMCRHLKPTRVVETGVAHGVTSRFILEALERNGHGHLWSIDRPPIEPEWRTQIGWAVDRRLEPRWTYINGSSRQRLPRLLSQLGEIDLFVHDSLHSARNVRFEVDHAWPDLTRRGAVVVDDIDVNRGFQTEMQLHPHAEALVCEAEPLHPDLRRFNQKGLFGILLNESFLHGSRSKDDEAALAAIA